jgi:type VI protein secretion system component VasF
MQERQRSLRVIVGEAFIDHRQKTELLLACVLVLGFLASTRLSNFDETLSKSIRSSLYGSLASTSGALLAGLAILVALPSTERMKALREHPKWERVPSAYFRAARALLAALALSTLGVALDSAKKPWLIWELATVFVLAIALVRVTAAVVALDQIVAVARTASNSKPTVNDPGR